MGENDLFSQPWYSKVEKKSHIDKSKPSPDWIATILVFQYCQLCVKLSDMDDFFRSLISRVLMAETRRHAKSLSDLRNVKCKLLSRDSSHGPGLALETQEISPDLNRLWHSENIHNWHWLAQPVWFSWLFQFSKNDKSGQHKNANYSDILSLSPDQTHFQVTGLMWARAWAQAKAQPLWRWEHYIMTSQKHVPRDDIYLQSSI